MAIPTAANIYDDAQVYLGDDEVAGGDLYTDAYLLTHLQTAVNVMFQALAHAESPLLEWTGYAKLPATQTYLSLDSSGLSYFRSPREIRSKVATGSGNVENIVWNAGTGRWRVTSTGHGRTSGDYVYIWKIADGVDDLINAEWPIVVIDADNFDLVGAPQATGVGSYSASTGEWLYSPDSDWSLPYKQATGIQHVRDSLVSGRWVYDFKQGALHFDPDPTNIRLLEINYRMKPDGIVSTAPNLRVRGSRDVLAYLTAGFAANAKGAMDKAVTCLQIAAGVVNPGMIDIRNPAGLLGSLANEHATARQEIIATQRYRSRGWSRSRSQW